MPDLLSLWQEWCCAAHVAFVQGHLSQTYDRPYRLTPLFFRLVLASTHHTQRTYRGPVGRIGLDHLFNQHLTPVHQLLFVSNLACVSAHTVLVVPAAVRTGQGSAQTEAWQQKLLPGCGLQLQGAGQSTVVQCLTWTYSQHINPVMHTAVW